MTTVATHHNAAMEHADAAILAHMAGDDASAIEHSRQAFESEWAAAQLVLDLPNNEPTRSVLLRSAACLAFDAGNMQEALRMVTLAMAGSPPQEIEAKLNDVVDSIRRLA